MKTGKLPISIIGIILIVSNITFSALNSKELNLSSEELARITEPIEPTPTQMLDAVITRPIKGENFPILPVLSTEMRSKVVNELFKSETIREAYSKLDARKSNTDWFKGISELEKLKAVWPLLSALCHYSDDVQIYALRSIRNIGDKQAVPFLIIYAEYMAVYESGSENATIHGIIHTEIADTLSTLTGIEVKISGQNPGKLKEGIHLWQKWQIQQEEKNINSNLLVDTKAANSKTLECVINTVQKEISPEQKLTIKASFKNISDKKYILPTNVWFWPSTSLQVLFIPEDGSETKIITHKEIDSASERDTIELDSDKTSTITLNIPIKNLSPENYEIQIRYISEKNELTSYIGMPPHPHRNYQNVWIGDIFSNTIRIKVNN